MLSMQRVSHTLLVCSTTIPGMANRAPNWPTLAFGLGPAANHVALSVCSTTIPGMVNRAPNWPTLAFGVGPAANYVAHFAALLCLRKLPSCAWLRKLRNVRKFHHQEGGGDHEGR